LLDRSPSAGHSAGSRMPTSPPPSAAPHARGSVIHGFRAAALDLWGEPALAAVADRLPLGTRVRTLDRIVLPFEWVPIEDAIAWHDALWGGPIAADEATLARFVARSIELGFGRFKAAFFSGITPDRLFRRAQELWRYQHTHGDVDVAVDGRACTVTLSGHPYVEHPTSRRVTAESFRHLVALALAQHEESRGRPVRAAWGTSARSLVVQLTWSA
jgi:hypothetical protein